MREEAKISASLINPPSQLIVQLVDIAGMSLTQKSAHEGANTQCKPGFVCYRAEIFRGIL